MFFLLEGSWNSTWNVSYNCIVHSVPTITDCQINKFKFTYQLSNREHGLLLMILKVENSNKNHNPL